MPRVLIFEPFPLFRFSDNMRVLVILLSAVLVAMLGACGYKGPLYLPKPKPEAQAVKPAPAQDPQNSGVQVPAKP
jgi:predicted small lipoprotein YifL